MYTQEQYEESFDLRRKGYSYKKISKELKINSPRTVYGWIRKGVMPQGHFLKPGFDTLTVELAYILGVIEGDGWIKLEKTKGCIGLEVMDKEFAETFKEKIEQWSGLRATFRLRKDTGGYVATLFSLRAAKFLKDFNILSLKNKDKDITSNFLKGFFDSEGTVCGSNLNSPKVATRFIAVFNNNETLIFLVKELIESLGINVQNIDKKIGSGFNEECINFRLRIGGKENIQKFKYYVGFSIHRKNKKLDEVIKSYIK